MLIPATVNPYRPTSTEAATRPRPKPNKDVTRGNKELSGSET